MSRIKKGPSFAEQLHKAADEPGKRKGERSRNGLKIAAARELERVGYRDLRVSDINEAAGVSNALFYVYFKNKEEITREVLSEFLASFGREDTRSDPTQRAPAKRSVIESIYRGNLKYARTFAANPGLMRCLMQFGDEIPEFGKLWRDWNAAWFDRSIKALAQDQTVALKTDAERLLAVASLGMMVDGVLRLLYVDEQPRMKQAVKDIGGTPEALALFLTRMWVRAVYGRDLSWAPVDSPEAGLSPA
jgi:AcrR family transcriptional regulator